MNIAIVRVSVFQAILLGIALFFLKLIEGILWVIWKLLELIYKNIK
jgi:hypothetical protein